MRPFLTAAMLCALHAPAAQSAERPNILFIYADDQSYKTLGCYGSGPGWVRTPHIDALAARGVRFERAYLGAWCMPSRASILTGRLQHGVESMTMEGTYPGSSYDPEACPFVPAEFRKAGYHTAQIGKWHTGTDTGFGRDWDYQIVWNRPGKPENAGNYYHDQILTFNGEDRQVGGYSTDNYTDWAVDYIHGKNRDAGKPWYLWLCYGAIHGPTTPADRHRGEFVDKPVSLPGDILGPWPGKPAYLNDTRAWARDGAGRVVMRGGEKSESNFDTRDAGLTYEAWVRQYNECNLAVDEGVGRLMKALKDSGQLENTLVVYTTDQGYGLGEHGFNQKVAPYDSTLASALIVSLPGRYPEGGVCEQAVNAPDLVDLFCRSAGVELPWETHGRDIRPLLRDPSAADWRSPTLMTHTGRTYGSDTRTIPTDERLTIVGKVPWYVMLRDGRFKYVRTLVAGETEEVYDLRADPEELRNLADDPAFAERLVGLRELAVAELRRTGAPFVDAMPPTKQSR